MLPRCFAFFFFFDAMASNSDRTFLASQVIESCCRLSHETLRSVTSRVRSDLGLAVLVPLQQCNNAAVMSLPHLQIRGDRQEQEHVQDQSR